MATEVYVVGYFVMYTLTLLTLLWVDRSNPPGDRTGLGWTAALSIFWPAVVPLLITYALSHDKKKEKDLEVEALSTKEVHANRLSDWDREFMNAELQVEADAYGMTIPCYNYYRILYTEYESLDRQLKRMENDLETMSEVQKSIERGHHEQFRRLNTYSHYRPTHRKCVCFFCTKDRNTSRLKKVAGLLQEMQAIKDFPVSVYKWVQPQGIHDSYTRNDIVIVGEKYYMSTLNANVYSPETSTYGWERLD